MYSNTMEQQNNMSGDDMGPMDPKNAIIEALMKQGGGAKSGLDPEKDLGKKAGTEQENPTTMAVDKMS